MNKKGFIFCLFVRGQLQQLREESVPNVPLPHGAITYARVLFDWEAKEEGELNMQCGDWIIVYQFDIDGWGKGIIYRNGGNNNSSGNPASFPVNRTDVVERAAAAGVVSQQQSTAPAIPPRPSNVPSSPQRKPADSTPSKTPNRKSGQRSSTSLAAPPEESVAGDQVLVETEPFTRVKRAPRSSPGRTQDATPERRRESRNSSPRRNHEEDDPREGRRAGGARRQLAVSEGHDVPATATSQEVQGGPLNTLRFFQVKCVR